MELADPQKGATVMENVVKIRGTTPVLLEDLDVGEIALRAAVAGLQDTSN